ncbi:MAG: hypothetical protein MI724_04520 [Spirochaetales bacterium]|nr:hypothetical protein [Spirochaetales bacterium]
MVSMKSAALLTSVMVALGAPLAANEMTVSIRLHNEQIYFSNSPIDILVTIRNETPDPLRFRMADNRLYSVDFNVRTADNRRIESSRDFIIGRAANQVFYRTVTLQPGEHLSFVEHLNDYIAAIEPGLYTVQARFYPELASMSMGTAVPSNAVNLTIRPGQTEEIRREMRFEAIVERELQRERFSPDEVVEYVLEAQRQGNWERFFLYLNLEKLYRQAPERDRRFVRLSEQEQLEELLRYRAELEARAVEQDVNLVVIPDEYEIIETRYSPNEGEVVAELLFNFSTYRERRRYTYRLERRNGFWEIIGYEVINLPNEALVQ